VVRRQTVFHLIHHLEVGGAETLVADLAPRFDPGRFEIVVGCLARRGPLYERLAERGVPTHFIGKRYGVDLAAVWRLRNLLRALHVDILHTHEFMAGFWGRWAGVLAGTPALVHTEHAEAGWHKPIKHRLCKAPLRRATHRFVAVSDAVRWSLIEREHVPAEKVVTIENGIDLDRFGPHVVGGAMRRRVHCASGEPLLGMVARCRHEKGGDVFVDALAELAARGRAFRAVVVGDGPDRNAWIDRAARKGLSDRLFFVGSVPDPAPWYAALDLVVCPSREESFGLVAVEAQAAAVPVVASRVGGLGRILADGENAVLVSPGDASALAQAIAELLDHPARARELAARGRAHATERFSIDRTVAAHEALYSTCLSGWK
jgi:glycosyltransferase involved in cell wall biosynthesis